MLMPADHEDAPTRRPRRRAARWLLGPALLLAAVAVNPHTVGAGFAPLEYIYNPFYVVIIQAGEVALALAGLLVLVPRIRDRLPRFVVAALLAGATSAILLGLFGFARWREWIHPPIKEVAEICECVREGKDPYLGRSELDYAERRFRSLDPAAEEKPEAALELAKALLNTGKIDESIALLQETLAAAESGGRGAAIVHRLRRALGIAHIRRGEVCHCVQMHGPESCLYPIQDGGRWADAGPARDAAAQFEKVLSASPEDLGCRWLLNLAHMAGGTWPDGVPSQFRIEPRKPPDSVVVPQFRDIAPSLGLDTFCLMGGVILEDFDRDGALDVVVSSYSPCEPMHFFHNNGDGSFADWSEKTGIAKQHGGFNLVQTDFDGDGRADIHVIRGAWMKTNGRQRDALLRQNEDGTFTDVGIASGLGEDAYPDSSAVWADYDNDGDLDVFVANERVAPDRAITSQLFRNEGNGKFSDVTRAAGLSIAGDVKSANWGDYDNDGDMDLYASDLGGPNALYRNNGDGTFTDVARSLGVAGQPPANQTFGSWWFDYDNDGWLDLFVAGFGAPVLDTWVAARLGRPVQAERLTLYRNDGRGGFVDVSRETGLDDVQMPMGANVGDVDSDGWPDIYLGTGYPTLEYLIPNALYKNVDGKRFVEVASAANVAHLQKGHAVALADMDEDGDLDVFAHMGGFYSVDRSANALFENLGPSGRSITLVLEGRRSNRPGIGARIRARLLDADGKERDVHAQAKGGGSFGASPFRVHLGAGQASKILELEVWWPASNTRQTFRDVPLDSVIEITESSPDLRHRPRRPVRFR